MGGEFLRPVEPFGMQKAQFAALTQDSYPRRILGLPRDSGDLSGLILSCRVPTQLETQHYWGPLWAPNLFSGEVFPPPKANPVDKGGNYPRTRADRLDCRVVLRSLSDFEGLGSPLSTIDFVRFAVPACP